MVFNAFFKTDGKLHFHQRQTRKRLYSSITNDDEQKQTSNEKSY